MKLLELINPREIRRRLGLNQEESSGGTLVPQLVVIYQ